MRQKKEKNWRHQREYIKVNIRAPEGFNSSELGTGLD